MLSAILRYSRRFVVTAAIGTALTLCLISASRLVRVHKIVAQAAKYESIGQTDKMISELSLAYRWAPAYPSLQAPVSRLYRDAASHAGYPTAIPAMRPRSFSAALPLLEKALLPADWLVYRFYSQFWPVPGVPPPDTLPVSVGDPDADRVEHPAEPMPSPTETIVSNAAAEAPTAPDTVPVPTALPESSNTAPEAQEVLTPEASPDAMWGVVILPDTAVFQQNGTKLRTVPAGSLVDVQRLQTVPSGEIVHGTVWSRAGTFANVILQRGNVEIYRGVTLAGTSRQHRELVSKRGELLGAIEVRKKELVEGASSLNPHQQDYRKIIKEYKQIEDESVKLKTEFDATTGGRRMELANRLRVLKTEQVKLMPLYQEVKQKKELWDRENSERHQNIDPELDPSIQRWTHDLSGIEEQLNSDNPPIQE